MSTEKFLKALQSDAPRQPIIVAELSGNHNKSLDRALRLVEEAAGCGVDAIKLQTYTADGITLDIARDEFIVNNPSSVWHGRSLHSLYREAQTPWDWHAPIIERARSLGLGWFSSPFDFAAVDFLEAFDPPCYKIASPEIVDLPLIAKCAQTGRALIISTGMASVCEIAEAVETARANGCERVLLLKCTTDYPASPAQANLSTIPHMRDLFRCPVGFSDHTLGVASALVATSLGAALIEKHFTLNRSDGGPDAHFSIEPPEMRQLVEQSHAAWQSLGTVGYGPLGPEFSYMRGRRSLYISRDLRAGDELNAENISSIRPGLGLLPKYYNLIVKNNVKLKCDAKKGTPLAWEMFM